MMPLGNGVVCKGEVTMDATFWDVWARWGIFLFLAGPGIGIMNMGYKTY
jgi:hypothetical protein